MSTFRNSLKTELPRTTRGFIVIMITRRLWRISLHKSVLIGMINWSIDCNYFSFIVTNTRFREYDAEVVNEMMTRSRVAGPSCERSRRLCGRRRRRTVLGVTGRGWPAAAPPRAGNGGVAGSNWTTVRSNDLSLSLSSDHHLVGGGARRTAAELIEWRPLARAATIEAMTDAAIIE